MKNMSEIMLDLSYSALFLKDKQLLKEVENMYAKMQTLERETLRFLFKVRESDEERIVIIDLIDEIKSVSKSALEIAKLINAQRFPEIVKNLLQETEERVITSTIGKKSSMNNKSLGTTKTKTFTKAQIIAIKREDSWTFNINKDTITKEGDILIAVGPKEAKDSLKRFAAG